MNCNNCGKASHISKNCQIPITSYGVLLFLLDKESKIIMIQRKDSLCYIELLRGKYSLHNIDKIKLLLKGKRNDRKESKTNSQVHIETPKRCLLVSIFFVRFLFYVSQKNSASDDEHVVDSGTIKN